MVLTVYEPWLLRFEKANVEAVTAGEMDESDLTTNIESWNLKVWPFAETPDRPVVAGKDRLKGKALVGPQMPFPVSLADFCAVAVVDVLVPARLTRATLMVEGAALAPET